MSKTSKSALLEQEAIIQAELRAENEARLKAETDRIEAEKRQAEALRRDAIRREASSCWCGVDHVSGERLTQPRNRPATTAEFGPRSCSVFVGNLPYEIDESAIRAALTDLIGGELAQRFRLAKEQPAPPVEPCDDADDYDYFWSAYHHAPRHRPKSHKGLGFISRRNPVEAKATIDVLQGHELITPRGRKFAIRANFARPHTGPSRGKATS